MRGDAYWKDHKDANGQPSAEIAAESGYTGPEKGSARRLEKCRTPTITISKIFVP